MRNYFFNVTFFQCYISLVCFTQLIKGGPAHRRLVQKLFRNYNSIERPILNEHQSIRVYLGMTLQQIVDFDEKMQNVILSGWLDMNWNDYNLVWDPEEYQNITTIRVPYDKIWIPDVLLYNSADDSFDSTTKVNAVVNYDGNVSYVPPGMFKSTCDFKIKDFPFDRQTCSLKFGSWTHDERSIILINKSDKGQNGSYIKNTEWILEGFTSYSGSMSYDCCPEKFPYVMFDIHIRRRTLYYEFNLIFPCIFISCLTLLGFMLPPDSGEKIGLEATILLVIITFSHIVSNSIPVSSLSISRIGLYFTSIIFISSSSIFANILVLIIHHRNVRCNQYMPRWFEILIYKYLVKILRMKIPPKIKHFYPPGFEKLTNKKRGDSKTTVKARVPNGIMKHYLYDFREEFSSFNENLSEKIDRKQNGDFFTTSQLLNKNYLEDISSSCSNITKRNRSFNALSSKKIVKLELNSTHVEQQTTDTSSSSMTREEIIMIKQVLNTLLNRLSIVSNKVEKLNMFEERTLRCKFAASVLDRLCLIIFSILLLISSSIVFTSENFLKSSDPFEKY